MVGDKGYTSKGFRNFLRQRGIRYTIHEEAMKNVKEKLIKKCIERETRQRVFFQD